MEIIGEKLLLRDFVEMDAEDIYKCYSNKNNTQYLGVLHNSIEESKEFIEKCISRSLVAPRLDYDFAILINNSDFIGIAGLYIKPIRETGKENIIAYEGEMGWVIDENYQGFGYGTETARMILSYGFKELKLHKIRAQCHENNHNSYKIMEKLGMRYESYRKDSAFGRIGDKNQWYSVREYSMLNNEYFINDKINI